MFGLNISLSLTSGHSRIFLLHGKHYAASFYPLGVSTIPLLCFFMIYPFIPLHVLSLSLLQVFYHIIKLYCSNLICNFLSNRPYFSDNGVTLSIRDVNILFFIVSLYDFNSNRFYKIQANYNFFSFYNFVSTSFSVLPMFEVIEL